MLLFLRLIHIGSGSVMSLSLALYSLTQPVACTTYSLRPAPPRLPPSKHTHTAIDYQYCKLAPPMLRISCDLLKGYQAGDNLIPICHAGLGLLSPCIIWQGGS